MLKNPISIPIVAALTVVGALGAAACTVVYVSENRARGAHTDNPACVFACESNAPTPAPAASAASQQ